MQSLSSANEQTFRTIVKPTVGSRGTVRVHLSNILGKGPITVGALHVGIVGTEPAIVPGTDVAVTFSGASSVTIPAGASLYSDPAKLSFGFGTLVAITAYISGSTSALPTHNSGAIFTEYATAAGAGNQTGDLAGNVVLDQQQHLSRRSLGSARKLHRDRRLRRLLDDDRRRRGV